ncbi:MAG: hypothetical protein R3B90_15230 [Planctomycetaceae bacterium]
MREPRISNNSADSPAATSREGDDEMAQSVLQQILKINPEDEASKAKLEEIRNRVFEENQQFVEVDASKGWIASGVTVRKGEPIRLAAEGSYKFIVTAELGPDGFPSKSIETDMGEGVPAGADGHGAPGRRTQSPPAAN